MCGDLGSEHTVLLFPTEVCYLPLGRVLTRFFQMREQTSLYGRTSLSDLLEEWESQKFSQ